MGRRGWIVKLINKTFHTRFFLAKSTKKSKLMKKIVENMLFKDDYILYLPRDDVIELNEEVSTSESIVLPSQIIETFIDKSNIRFLMDFCLCRQSNKCEDYPIEYGCLFLGEAASDINTKWGRLVSKEEAKEHIKKTHDAGLVHLIGRNKIDSVWLGVQPKEKLLTICHCCPCCCLWKVLPYLDEELSSNVKKMPGAHIEVTDDCIGCGLCAIDVCFIDAISIVDGKAIINDSCRICGRCASMCPPKAIRVTLTNDQFYNECVENISSVVNVE
ncbi:MAG: DUF362 domain-containing protein [Promethearchaeota archaeon]